MGEGNAQFAFNVTYAPPDTVGEAGLTQFVQWVNPSFAIFDKATGNRLYGPAAGNTIWSGFGGDCEARNDGDPMVQYDQLADRWVMSQFSLRAGNYLQCVAVSKTSDATGEWHRYAFQYNHFPDYPKLAVWPDAYYMTFNMFGPTGASFTGGRVCAYDRLKMLEGLPASQICYQSSTIVPLLPRLGPGGQDAAAGGIAELCDDALGRRRHESLQVQAELCRSGVVNVHRTDRDPGERVFRCLCELRAAARDQPETRHPG